MPALRQRLLIATLILPPGLLCIWIGGWLFLIVVLIFFLPAAFEYTQMMRKAGHRPALLVVLGGVLTLVLAQSIPVLLVGFQPSAALVTGGALTLMLTLALTWHLVDYERGAATAGTDWAITVAGMVYLGWMAGYAMLIRALPDGRQWMFIVLGCIWLADTGAYVVGKRWGRRPLAPRLSPKKTWEGFVGGLLWAMGFGMLFGAIGSMSAPQGSAVGIGSGAVIGFMMGLAGTLGDLGISMFKRQVGLKDTSNVLGAHGGILDRIDSWIVAMPLAYFAIRLFFPV